jgi:hypothetical protein
MFNASPRSAWLGGLAAAALTAGLLAFFGPCARRGSGAESAKAAEVSVKVENHADARWSLRFEGSRQTLVCEVRPQERTEVHLAPGRYRVTQTLIGGESRIFPTEFSAGGAYRWALLSALSSPSSSRP